MACNAIATATAQVPVDQQVGKFLTNDQAQVILLAHLKQTQGQAQWYPHPTAVVIGCPGFEIFYQGGQVNVKAKSFGVSPEGIAQTLATLLAQAAGIMFQNVIAQYLGQMGYIEGIETTPDGAMVVTMEV